MNEEKNSDGYHTFDELYAHRSILYIALCRFLSQEGIQFVWRSRNHADGSMFPNMFILGIDRRKGYQITYHLDMKYWDDCDFAETLKKAPKWDKHTPEDVLVRLALL